MLSVITTIEVSDEGVLVSLPLTNHLLHALEAEPLRTVTLQFSNYVFLHGVREVVRRDRLSAHTFAPQPPEQRSI